MCSMVLWGLLWASPKDTFKSLSFFSSLGPSAVMSGLCHWLDVSEDRVHQTEDRVQRQSHLLKSMRWVCLDLLGNTAQKARTGQDTPERTMGG